MTATNDVHSDEWFDTGTSSPNGDPAGNYSTIADAEDYAKFIRKPRTVVSKDYERRVKAMLKAGVFGAINIGDLADAATIIHYGPDFAVAMGDLADADERFRKGLDLITTPANPYAMAAMVCIPFVAQLFRNHESELAEVPKTFRQRRAARKANPENFQGAEITIPLLRRRIRLGFRVKLRNPVKMFTSGVRSQTRDPNELIVRVFSDSRLRTALERQGIRIQVTTNE